MAKNNISSCSNHLFDSSMFEHLTRALMEAQDIFGLDFDFDEFEKYGREDYSSGEEEEDYLDEDDEDGVLRRPKKKPTKKSIYEVSTCSQMRDVKV